MTEISSYEVRFMLLISSIHLFEHFLMRLIPPLIPVLATALMYPLWQLGLLVSIFYFASGLSQAPLGVLSDRYDRQLLLPTGLGLAGASYVLFAIAPLIGAITPTITVFELLFDGGFLVMCVAMLGVGIGTSVVHPTAYPLITANVTEEHKGKTFGVFGSSSKIGDAAGPAVVAILILVLLWSEILLILGLLAVAWGVVLYWVLGSDEFDTVPADYGTTDDASDSQASAPADRRAYAYPMVAIYAFFVTKMFAGASLNTYVPVFLVSVYAYSADIGNLSIGPESVANVYFSLLLVSAAISQIFLGGLTDRFDARAVIISCLGLATVALLGLALLELPPVSLLLVMLMLGAGLWGMNPARDALISEITPPEREGRTFGYIWSAVRLSGTAVIAFVGYVLEAVGMREGFLILSLGTVFAAVSIGLLYSTRVYQPAPHRTVSHDVSD